MKVKLLTAQKTSPKNLKPQTSRSASSEQFFCQHHHEKVYQHDMKKAFGLNSCLEKYLKFLFHIVILLGDGIDDDAFILDCRDIMSFNIKSTDPHPVLAI